MAKRLKISQVINSVEAGIIILDNDAKIFSWNKWISDATKIKLSDVKGKSLFDIFEEPISTRLTTAVADAIEKGQSTFLSHRLNKHPLPLYKKYITAEEKQNIHQKTSVSSLILDDGRCYCVISVTDVSASVEREDSLKQQTSELRKLSEQLKISEENTRFMAFHDALTKIPNRTLFYDRLNMAVSQTDRQENFLAVMLIDIDFFKEINDSYGHDTGDQFLVEIAQRLKDTLRRADTVSRLGGDEFAIVLTDQKSIDGIETIVQMLYNKLTAPMFLTDKNIKPSVSIGISLFPNDSTESYDLLKNADLALYNVKHHGRSGYRFYSSKMRSDLTLRQKQQDLLREALTDDRIVVYYQPIFGLSDNQIHSLEALVRYVDKNNELVMPNEFISLAEEFDLINKITISALRHICRLCEAWDMPERPKFSINVSAKQFFDPSMVVKIQKTHMYINKYGFELEVELTESVLMKNPTQGTKIIEQFSNMGISIALDDFGTGYSSLEYLKRFNLNKLKIDRSY